MRTQEHKWILKWIALAASCAALGERVHVVTQREPFDDPAAITPARVLAAIEQCL